MTVRPRGWISRSGRVGLVLAILATGAAGGLWYRERERRGALAEAQRALNEGRLGAAGSQLDRILERWPEDGEALLLLGECELGRGDRDRALDVWARVSGPGPVYRRAAVLRATQLINAGRWTESERVLDAALSSARSEEPAWYDLMRTRSRLYRFEGRMDDVRRVLRASWCRSPDPAGVLKELWTLDHSPMPVEAVQIALDKTAPDDDRAWLGQANFAILAGRFADATGWLDRALARRPDDPAIWRAKLALAKGVGDLHGVGTAAGHLPAGSLGPDAFRALRAWVSRSLGRVEDERRELESLIREDPGDTEALERLAVLAIEAGDSRRAEGLRRRKAEVDRLLDRGRKLLLLTSDPWLHAEELAGLCGAIGRGFDASAWSLLAEAQAGAAEAGRPPSIPPRLLDRAVALSASYGAGPRAEDNVTLADRVDDLLGSEAIRSARSPAVGEDRSDGAALRFVDDVEAAGLRFIYESGRTVQHLLPETMSGGVGLLDYDGDGWLDVYCVQGGPLLDRPARGGPATASGDRLFRNRGDGTFEDVSERTGITTISQASGYGMGVAVGDYDNDGDPDLFTTRLDTYALYRNRGDGTFEDATGRAGLAGRRDNPSSAALADLDGDGDLDLYVCHYMIWDAANPRTCRNGRGEYFYCDPSRVEPAPDHAFRNDGGRFVDVTREAGIVDNDGRGLGVVAADLNDDGRIDLYVANDGTANFLFLNRGGFRFDEAAAEAGVAGSASGGYQAGMGVACGDLDGDGRPDLLVTNFYGEGATYYCNLGEGLFADMSGPTGFGLATRYLLGFGIALADVDNSGRCDVLVTNGHVNDNRPYFPYAMPCRLYANRPDGRLVDVSREAGDCWEIPRVGRGLAVGDLDNDGRVDALVLAQDEPMAYFHNRSEDTGRFLTLRLEGDPASGTNRDGVGAVVSVIAGGRRQVAHRFGGGSYQSAGDPRVHFGLLEADRADAVEVRWPSGRVDRHKDLPAGAGYLLREGGSRPRPLPGFARPPGASRPG